MRVVVEILTGPLFYVDVGENATVAELKKEIGSQQEVPTDQVILILYAGDLSRLITENDLSLAEYGVGDGSHLYLFFHPLNNGSSTTHFHSTA
ncbi:hypothetical protein NMG60_11003094 [Bertholletia excelsa]